MKTNLRRLLLLGLVLVAGGFYAARPPAPPPEVRLEAPLLAPLYAPAPERTEQYRLDRGQTLSGVLSAAAIVGSELNGLLLSLREHIDPRRVRPDTRITVRRWTSDGSPRAVEVRVNPDTLLRLDREPFGWASTVIETPVRVDTVYHAGRIERGRTLYEAIVRDDALGLPEKEREALVWQLAHVYGYKLDFAHDIMPGDGYRLVYERLSRPDGSARGARLLAAEVVSRGEPHLAVRFDPGNGGDYFDEKGASLRLAFRRYPVDYVRVTSSFAWRRYHPIRGVYRAHLGTDFGAPTGTPVRATADGVVRFAGRDGGYGNVVVIRHFHGYTTRYAHLSRFAARGRQGTRVEQGDVIGYVGSTGLSTGPHLHYELRQNGKAMNPARVRLPAAPPVPRDQREAYYAVRDARLEMLERAGLPPLAQVAAGAEEEE